MRKCPDCGIEISVTARWCTCGWKQGGNAGHAYRWATKADGEWIDLQCTFDAQGIRCEHYGTLSPSTMGHGPWYCREHFGQGGVRDYASAQSSRSGWLQAKRALEAMRRSRQPGQDDE